MRNLRHQVRVLRPATPQGEAGEKLPPEVLYREQPCSIEQTAGRESERMFQMYATTTLKVEMYGDPEKPLTPVCWLEELPLKSPPRRLNILEVNDVLRNGTQYKLVCSEGEGL